MPFQRQTLPQWIAQAKATFQAKMPGADTALRRSVISIASIILGGIADAVMGYLDWIIANVLLPTSAIFPYSLKWGSLKGLSPNPPVAATGSATIANGIPGTPVPAGTLVQLSPGLTFQTTAPVTLDGGGNGTALIAAILPSATSDGSLWNCDAGATLQLIQAIAGVPGTWTVAADITNGAAPETNTSFIASILAAFRNPPQGGDFADYIAWALAAPNVTRAWVNPLAKGAGTVLVYIMCDVSESAFNGFPQGTNGVATGETRDTPATGDQLVAANSIFPKRPVTALVYLYAPTASPQNFTLKYVPSGQQALATAAIAQTLLEEGSAATINPTTYAISGGIVELADIQAAVRAVPGCSEALVVSPTDNISTSIGQLPTVGTVTFE